MRSSVVESTEVLVWSIRMQVHDPNANASVQALNPHDTLYFSECVGYVNYVRKLHIELLNVGVNFQL